MFQRAHIAIAALLCTAFALPGHAARFVKPETDEPKTQVQAPPDLRPRRAVLKPEPDIVVAARRLDRPVHQVQDATLGARMFRLDRPTQSAKKPSSLEVYWQGLGNDGSLLLRIKDVNAASTVLPFTEQGQTNPLPKDCRSLVWVTSDNGPKNGISDWTERWPASTRCMEINQVLLRIHAISADRVSFEVSDLMQEAGALK